MNPYDSRYMLLQKEKLKNILSKQVSVKQVAKELLVSRQTLHKWLSRYRRFGSDGLIIPRKKHHVSAHNRTSPVIEQLVINTAREYWNDGAETLHDRLVYAYQITLHPTTIYRILKRTDTRYTGRYGATKRQWKKQLYAHQIPGKELQMDTKYPLATNKAKSSTPSLTMLPDGSLHGAMIQPMP